MYFAGQLPLSDLLSMHGPARIHEQWIDCPVLAWAGVYVPVPFAVSVLETGKLGNASRMRSFVTSKQSGSAL